MLEKMDGESKIEKKNPWEEIKLDDYEKHMSLDSVKQLQIMNKMMKKQLDAYPVTTAMILGIAGGNGLEHVSKEKYQIVHGVDINKEYLEAVSRRYVNLEDVLQCLQVDLITEASKLPHSQLLIANLLIEYIGYQAFENVLHQVDPDYVSCAIQINTDEKSWVSDSPYIHVFERLDEVHCQMERNALASVIESAGYQKILEETEPLPNGKALVRMDFKKGKEGAVR